MRAFVRLLHVLKLPGGRGKKAEKERENEEMGEEDIFFPHRSSVSASTFQSSSGSGLLSSS